MYQIIESLQHYLSVKICLTSSTCPQIRIYFLWFFGNDNKYFKTIIEVQCDSPIHYTINVLGCP